MISWRASWPWLHILGPFHRVPCIRWNHAADGQTVTGKFLQHEAVQMADWSTVTLVPGMRFSSCPSIRGSHWLKFASRPAKSKQDLWSLGTQNIKKVKEMTGRDGESFSPRWRCRKASVALLERSMAISGSISPFSFISFPIQLPVRKVKSGKLWWTVPLMKDRSSKKTTDLYTTHKTTPTSFLPNVSAACTWWWSFSSVCWQSPASSCGWCSPPTGTSLSWWRRSAASPVQRSRRLKGTSRRPTPHHTWLKRFQVMLLQNTHITWYSCLKSCWAFMLDVFLLDGKSSLLIYNKK